MTDTADPRDDVEQLAVRVADKWFPGDDGYTYAEERNQLIRIIASDLRAGGWVKGRAGPHVASEDLSIS